MFVGKREIQELGVFCDNIDRSCKWQGTVATLKNHIASCPFALLTCPNKCQDKDGKFLRKDLPEHLLKACPNREYECCFCGKNGTYVTITNTHFNTCLEKPVNCTNSNCNEIVRRCGMKRHRQECLFTEVQCKFQGIGCAAKRMRKDMKEHEMDDSSHLHIALEAIAEQQKDKNKTAKVIAELHKRLQETIEQRVTKFKLKNYNCLSILRKDFTSPRFYSSPGGYCMVLKVSFKTSGCFGTYIFLESGDNDEDLAWPFQGAVTITLLNQLENKHHLTRTVHFKASAGVEVSLH